MKKSDAPKKATKKSAKKSTSVADTLAKNLEEAKKELQKAEARSAAARKAAATRAAKKAAEPAKPKEKPAAKPKEKSKEKPKPKTMLEAYCKGTEFTVFVREADGVGMIFPVEHDLRRAYAMMERTLEPTPSNLAAMTRGKLVAGQRPDGMPKSAGKH